MPYGQIHTPLKYNYYATSFISDCFCDFCKLDFIKQAHYFLYNHVSLHLFLASPFFIVSTKVD